MNIYADIDCDLEKMLHGAARLHVHLGRMDGESINTRNWSYNDLVSGILALQAPSHDRAITINRCVDTLFDTLDAFTEIGVNAISYLQDLQQIK